MGSAGCKSRGGDVAAIDVLVAEAAEGEPVPELVVAELSLGRPSTLPVSRPSAVSPRRRASVRAGQRRQHAAVVVGQDFAEPLDVCLAELLPDSGVCGRPCRANKSRRSPDRCGPRTRRRTTWHSGCRSPCRASRQTPPALRRRWRSECRRCLKSKYAWRFEQSSGWRSHSPRSPSEPATQSRRCHRRCYGPTPRQIKSCLV